MLIVGRNILLIPGHTYVICRRIPDLLNRRLRNRHHVGHWLLLACVLELARVESHRVMRCNFRSHLRHLQILLRQDLLLLTWPIAHAIHNSLWELHLGFT